MDGSAPRTGEGRGRRGPDAAGTTVIIELLGGVAMLLWGVRMVRTGIMRGWGDRLKHFIQQRLSNNMSAFLD